MLQPHTVSNCTCSLALVQSAAGRDSWAMSTEASHWQTESSGEMPKAMLLTQRSVLAAHTLARPVILLGDHSRESSRPAVTGQVQTAPAHGAHAYQCSTLYLKLSY